jgi:ATP-dependent DNA helicase RecG
MEILPVSLDDLLHARTVESVRLELKKTWNPVIADAAFQTLCAFANDLQGLGGGYVVLGVEEAGGAPVLPPHGLDDLDMDRVQKEIRGQCKGRIDPEYQPVIAPVVFQGKRLLVLWAPMGDLRPYQVRKDGSKGSPFEYYVRLGSQTVAAVGEIRTQLLQLTAKVPFDDRRRLDVPLSAISEMLLRRFLADVQSDLGAPGVELPAAEILRSLRLSVRVNGSEAPRNVALLFFTDRPDEHFDGAYIEVAHFRDDSGGDLIETRPFRGSLPQQIRATLDYLDGMAGSVIRKVPGQAEAERFVAFPHDAMREAIVNAVYHRGYDGPPQPVRIGLYPDRLEITSAPGPVPGLMREHLAPGGRPPQIPARNPRVGELLKSLRLAETWHTGVPKIRRRMLENGSPEPTFDFDDARTYFRVTLPAHPGYVVLHAMREAAGLWHTGERGRAIARLDEARSRVPTSGALSAQRIEYAAAMDDLPLAEKILVELEQTPLAADTELAYAALARARLDRGDTARAREMLRHLPPPRDPQDAVEQAILYKRSGDFQAAHRVFASIEEAIQRDPKALHEFAQTKLAIARGLRRAPDVKRRLNEEAAALLRRVIALAADQPTRAAWAWFDLARTLAWLRAPESEVVRACERAVALDPTQDKFRAWLDARRGRGA